MRLPRTRTAAALAAAAGMIVALTLPHPAAAASPVAPALTAVDHQVAVDAGPVELLAALRHDLGLSAEQARARLARVDTAVRTERHLQAELDGDFGGAWLADGGRRLVVAVTDPLAADRVVAAGAEPRLVSHNEEHLDTVKAKLDRAGSPPRSITSWYVDVESNTVVVEARPHARLAAARFLAASGVADEPVRIEQASGSPQVLQPHPLREGDPYYINGLSRCTVGPLVVTSTSGDNGFVTAGHCGSVGDSTRGFNFEPQGIVRASSFPGADYAVVMVNDDWLPEPSFAGSQEAPIGATVCKRGPTTGLTCGIITHKNQTVNYPQGVVSGLTRTTICAEPGDSGAPVFTPDNQVQGTMSGGSGSCTSGGFSFFQPLNPVLSALNLTLLTT